MELLVFFFLSQNIIKIEKRERKKKFSCEKNNSSPQSTRHTSLLLATCLVGVRICKLCVCVCLEKSDLDEQVVGGGVMILFSPIKNKIPVAGVCVCVQCNMSSRCECAE